MQNKTLRAITAIAIIFSSTVLIVSFYCSAAPSSSRDNATYLIVGLDDAAENADSIMIVNSNFESGKLTVMHIPRDTYYKYGAGQNKINGLYPFLRSRSENKAEALTAFLEKISTSLGIHIDGAFALTISTFGEIVDKIGGVKIEIKERCVFLDENSSVLLSLDSGEHTLYSEDAKIFVRHRKGYRAGDLSRIDMQKLFVTAFIKNVSELSSFSLLKAYDSVKEDLISTIPLTHFLKNAPKLRGRIKDQQVRSFTAPGEPIYSSEGISYYSLNSFAMKKALETLFLTKEFDTDKSFLKDGDVAFENVYFDSNFDFEIHTS